MAVRLRGKTYYVCFVWKSNRMDTATLATSESEAKRIEKAVKTAFDIYRFDHLDPAALEVAVSIFKNKGWKVPSELQTPEPEEELTLLRGIDDYLRADEKKYQRSRQERKVRGATINIEVGVLSGIFRHQIEQERLRFNPCSLVRRLPE